MKSNMTTKYDVKGAAMGVLLECDQTLYGEGEVPEIWDFKARGHKKLAGTLRGIYQISGGKQVAVIEPDAAPGTKIAVSMGYKVLRNQILFRWGLEPGYHLEIRYRGLRWSNGGHWYHLFDVDIKAADRTDAAGAEP